MNTVFLYNWYNFFKRVKEGEEEIISLVELIMNI